MELSPFSPNIIIKVPKQEESQKREKIGAIYLHPAFVWMTRNTQYGIIHSISPEAQKNFPTAKVGQLLICHHFVQASHSLKESEKRFLVHEDETYFYYTVTTKEWNGQNNQSYGVFDGENIIPHKDYVFLEKELPVLNYKKEVLNGIEIPEFHQTTDEIYAKLEEIKAEIMNLTKTKMSPEIRSAIIVKEKEQSAMTKKLHEKKYLPYTIAFANKKLGISNNQIALCLNIGCATVVEFQEKEYRICPSKYVAGSYN
jgi:DNA-binding transcriptional regulator YiaG